MTKKKKKRDEIEELERCTATVKDDGTLDIFYKWAHLPVSGHQSHDEDVSEWTDQEIIDLVAALICAEGNNVAKIRVEWQ